MRRYAYGFHLHDEDGETFFRFRQFPEIISSIDTKPFAVMNREAILAHAHDAVITALQAIITLREDVPPTDDPRLDRADGFVLLSVREAMKMELYLLYKANCKSVAEFARQLGKRETAAHRLLDLRHPTKASEIESAVKTFGKRLAHIWQLEAAA
jgi:hypothetical protein